MYDMNENREKSCRDSNSQPFVHGKDELVAEANSNATVQFRWHLWLKTFLVVLLHNVLWIIFASRQRHDGIEASMEDMASLRHVVYVQLRRSQGVTATRMART